MQREEFLARWGAYTQAVDQALDAFLTDALIPSHLLEAMRYSVFAGGKRLRPTLTLAAAQMLGGDEKEVLGLACGLEMIHTYSLIHDDLPAMDNDDLRRGRPTSHKVFGEAQAILAGDALLSHAFEVMMEAAPKRNDKLPAYLRAMQAVARGAGARGMVAGQAEDLLNEGNPQAGAKELSYIHEHKTGDMILAAVLAPAYALGAGDAALKKLEQFGRNLGLAFQVVDDLLDVVGEQEKMGKTLGKDQQEEKLTFVKVYGLEQAQKMAQEYTQSALQALEYFGEKADFLRKLTDYMLKRNH